MLKFVAPVILITGLALGQGVLAANAPATVAVASKPPAKAASPADAAKAAATAKKHTACEKTWSDQKKHVGKHKAFIAACVAKG